MTLAVDILIADIDRRLRRIEAAINEGRTNAAQSMGRVLLGSDLVPGAYPHDPAAGLTGGEGA